MIIAWVLVAFTAIVGAIVLGILDGWSEGEEEDDDS